MAFTPVQDSAWRTLERRWGDLTFDGLSAQEKEVISLFWLEGEMMNGGLIQYFSNSSGDLVPYAISGLRRVGARETLALLESAISKLNVIDYPIDRGTRLDALEKLGNALDPFDAETNAMQELPDRFFESALEELASTYQAGHV